MTIQNNQDVLHQQRAAFIKQMKADCDAKNVRLGETLQQWSAMSDDDFGTRADFMIEQMMPLDAHMKMLRATIARVHAAETTLATARKTGDGKTATAAGAIVDEGIIAYAELSPEFRKEFDKLVRNDSLQDERLTALEAKNKELEQRVQATEDRLEPLDEQVPGYPTFTPHREGEAAALAAAPTPTAPAVVVIPTPTTAIPVNPNPVTTGLTPTQDQMVEKQPLLSGLFGPEGILSKTRQTKTA